MCSKQVNAPPFNTDSTNTESKAVERWPVRIPTAFSRKIAPKDMSGPLARQVLPTAEELESIDGFSDDPVGDEDATVNESMLVKYDGRALLLVTSHCAIHCRFCFRKAYTQSRPEITPAMRDAAVSQLKQMPDISEVILSGGDPLMLDNKRLEGFLTSIEDIPHVVRIRLHSRMITAAPERITPELCNIIKALTKPFVAVTHVNHPDELDDETATSLDRLRDCGAVLLNQSVLLRGVNDTADIQTALVTKLVSQGVIPYYLHQLDRVNGAAHFEVPESEGRAIVEAMRRRCPGYMVPRYVKEIPGATSKTAIS